MDSAIPVSTFMETLLAFSATKYATVASMTVLVWDMFLSLDIEISRVWLAKKNFGTTLFFLNRYIPPALFAFDLYAQFAVSPSITVRSFCTRYQLSSTIMDLVSIAIIQAVLIMRTHALYQNRIILTFLASLGLGSIVNMLICFLVVWRYESFGPASSIGFVGCLASCTDSRCQPLLIAFWLPFFLLETVVFWLTLWKSYLSFKITRLHRSSDILTILIRDGILYYVVIMTISMCNFLTWTFNPSQSFIFIALLKSLQATICSRILLNLRGAFEAKSSVSSRFENQRSWIST
ncbi:hypothetical protein B0H34DRAFT_702743, partial [Crassisporium funariophilum]